jgi:hypothetical protein
MKSYTEKSRLRSEAERIRVIFNARVSRAVASKLAQGALAAGEASTAGKYFCQCSDTDSYRLPMTVPQLRHNLVGNHETRVTSGCNSLLTVKGESLLVHEQSSPQAYLFPS